MLIQKQCVRLSAILHIKNILIIFRENVNINIDINHVSFTQICLDSLPYNHPFQTRVKQKQSAEKQDKSKEGI